MTPSHCWQDSMELSLGEGDDLNNDRVVVAAILVHNAIDCIQYVIGVHLTARRTAFAWLVITDRKTMSSGGRTRW